MVRTELRRDGSHQRIVIDHPKGNVLSIAVIRELRRAIADIERLPRVRLVTIEGAGDHFCYGASVEEHRQDRIAEALGELHGLVGDLLECGAPTVAVVRGRCLGGGFELALACDVIFAAEHAAFGVPEISLGVFPPAAAALLPPRIGASRAASAVLTGRIAPAAEWAAAGLIERIVPAGDLTAAVDLWFDEHIAPRSAAALRCAVRASRRWLAGQVAATLPQLERFYIDTLMRTRDAAEGIDAFLEKRPPQWMHT
jgi:cyclohexa-1,5-dienecarbonyl-CoA hydratase